MARPLAGAATLPRRDGRLTINDVAAAAGVSKSTVSLVLRGSTLVSGATRDRVEEAARRLGYVYNRGAAALRSSSSSLVALVIPDLTNPFFALLAVAVEAALGERGHVPILASTGDSPARQREVVRSMREHGAAGLVMSPAHGTRAADVAALGLPAVAVMRRLADGPAPGLPYIGPDNVAGARAVGRHLIAAGHRRLAFVGGHGSMPTQRERLMGLRAAMGEAGIDPKALRVCDAPPTRAGGRAAARALLDGPGAAARPTAIAAYNDVVAFGVLAAARHGPTVGRDLALTGFDDLPEAAEAAPPLTSVDVHVAELGRRAAHALLARIAGDADVAPETLVPPRLVARASSSGVA